MEKILTVWIPARKSIKTEANPLDLSAVGGNSLNPFSKKHNGQNNERDAEKNHEGKLPRKIKAHDKTGDNRKRRLQIVGERRN